MSRSSSNTLFEGKVAEEGEKRIEKQSKKKEGRPERPSRRYFSPLWLSEVRQQADDQPNRTGPRRKTEETGEKLLGIRRGKRGEVSSWQFLSPCYVSECRTDGSDLVETLTAWQQSWDQCCCSLRPTHDIRDLCYLQEEWSSSQIKQTEPSTLKTSQKTVGIIKIHCRGSDNTTSDEEKPSTMWKQGF